MLTVTKQKICSKSLLKSPWALSLLAAMDCQRRNSRIFLLSTICAARPKIIATYHFCRVKCAKACREKIAARWRGGGPTLTRLWSERVTQSFGKTDVRRTRAPALSTEGVCMRKYSTPPRAPRHRCLLKDTCWPSSPTVSSAERTESASEERRVSNPLLQKTSHVLLKLEAERRGYKRVPSSSFLLPKAPPSHDWAAKSFLIATSVVLPNALTSHIICNGMEKWSEDNSSKWELQTGEQVI